MFDFDPKTAADPRLNPNLPVRAYAYVKTTDAWVFKEPNPTSIRQTQFLFGENVTVHEQQGEYYLVQSQVDSYTGWVHGSLLQQIPEPLPPAPYRICATAAVTIKPDMKSPLLTYLAIDSLVSLEAQKGDYLKIVNHGWVHCRHICDIKQRIDPVVTAYEQLNRSYIWGARSISGLDCSALTQLCYRRAGRNIPRDSDLQHKYMHKHHQPVRGNELQGGDLIFMPGHVMIAVDEKNIIHANSYYMRVTKEPLKEVITRAKKEMGDKFGIRAYRWKSSNEE